MHRRVRQALTSRSGTPAALGRARDLLKAHGMHQRADALQKLAELVAKKRSQQHIIESRAQTRLEQLRPSGRRGGI